MLNVPEIVKALFKQDGIRKNFRVHFPGGELPDITNDNVVQESVRFTESLCSQDVLKFGLTEASVLEFETVGVANMYGMTIEAGIEIGLSSLSAAELAEIEAGSWDGVYVSESDTDLGFPFFRVPYGVFRVESCPRDHQAMTHRKVQAYAVSGGNYDICPVERFKLFAALSNNPSYNADVKKLIYANLGFRDTDAMYDAGYTLQKICDLSETKNYISTVANSITVQVSPVSDPSTYTTFTISIRMKQIHINGTTTPAPDELYNLDGSDYDPVTQGAISTLRSYFILRQVTNVTTGELRTFTNWEAFFNYYAKGGCAYIIDREYNGTVEESMYRLYSPSTTYSKSIPCFYPTRGITVSPSNSGYYDVVLSFVSYIHASSGSMIINQQPDMSKVILNQWVDSEPDFTITLNATATENGKSSFLESYNLKKLINDRLEYYAQFGKVDRDGFLTTMRLSNANPVSIIPGNYSGFWWDEYDVLPIGTVNFSFKNSEADSNENIISYQFGDGDSVYEITDNGILNALSDATAETVESMLDETFIPYLGPITFTPIDLEMKGLPYLEAGDYLAVTAEDGTIANSFVMRHEISGVQILTAHIESTSGDIISSEEAES